MLAKISTFLDAAEYEKAFETNLNEDELAKNFWAKQLPVLIQKFADQATSSDETEDCSLRVKKYQTKYQEKVDILMNSDEFLSVRMLLSLNEVLLKEYDFKDVWQHQKEAENLQAISNLTQRLQEIDQIDEPRKRWEELFRGVLAGNIFDSGATAVQKILEENHHFGLEDALLKIRDRPWLIDSFDQFMDRLKNGPKHNCAAFFCDNSGVDILLGVIPFIRELLKRNIKVILCANSEPSLNDVTHNELVKIIVDVAEKCSIIKSCLANESLVLKSSGQEGCCLNFLKIDEKLLDLMILYKVDLIVIEGMGRSLHTNLNSSFKCDSLKLAVIKNKFLASRLGGNLFDAICKYESMTT